MIYHDNKNFEFKPCRCQFIKYLLFKLNISSVGHHLSNQATKPSELKFMIRSVEREVIKATIKWKIMTTFDKLHCQNLIAP